MGVVWVWLPVPDLRSEKLATMHSASELSEVECQHHETAAYTVEPLLTDPPRSGLPLNNGHISRNGMTSHRASVF